MKDANRQDMEHGVIDVTAAVKLKEAESRTAVQMKHAESKARKEELLIRESAKETASKHLAKFAGLYLLICVITFIYSIQMIPESAIAVVAGMVTLVVTNLSNILKGIVDNGSIDKPSEDTKKPEK